jgi:Tol biopolymer transport system component
LYELPLLAHLIKEVIDLKRIISLAILAALFLLSPYRVDAEDGKAVYVRKDGLWLKSGENERKLVQGDKITHPSFSSDGRFVSYLSGDQNELWVYNTITRLKKRVFPQGASMPRWSPVGYSLAWKSGSILNAVDVREPGASFYNVALGVGNYSWTSDGKGFIVSSAATLAPDGWEPVKIFNVPLDAAGDMQKAKRIATLPKESDNFFAVSTTEFKWSSGGREVAFIACPTASLSADSNYLMKMDKNGKRIKIIGEMLSNPNWFHWSPVHDQLAFIKGIGRLTSENKKLTVWDSKTGREISYGAERFADGDFTWQDHNRIVVSRQKEWSWNTPEAERSTPFLVQVDIQKSRTEKVTKPPKGRSDVYPKTLPKGELVWVRVSEKSGRAKVMRKKSTHSQEKTWIKDLKPLENCYGWHCVLDIYKSR